MRIVRINTSIQTMEIEIIDMKQCQQSISGRFILDRVTINGWLKRKVELLSFEDTVSAGTGEVICAHVPLKVRQILKTFLIRKKQVIFNSSFVQRVGKIVEGTLMDIVTAFDDAVKKYQTIQTALQDGT